MKEILNGLEKWRSNRNLTNHEFVARFEIANILEEYTEYLRAEDEHEQIDALCDMCVFSYNAISYLGCDVPQMINRNIGVYTLDNLLSAVNDIKEYDHHKENADCFAIIILLCKDRIKELGYDYEKCMLETIKEITSRVQDPQQMKDWAENGANGKWQKFKGQPESTKYKADYSLCVLT